MLDLKSLVLSQLSLVAWREGNRLAPGSRDAMLGIAFVLQNRVKGGHWDGDWLKCIYNNPAHSASEISDMDFQTLPDPWDPTWRWLVERVDKLYDGDLLDTITWSANATKPDGKDPRLTLFAEKVVVNGIVLSPGNPSLLPRPAYFYANLTQKIRPWFVEKVIHQPENHPRVSECYPLTFFG